MGIMIAGVSSGSGKTTLTIGLMRALRDRNLTVAGFKSGPDYIDPMFHRLATGNPSYNLPTWMVPDDALAYLYNNHSESVDLAVIEGVMGYFDGHDPSEITGSSAHLAQVIDTPVLIVMDGSSTALTAAAILSGLIGFQSPSKIKGVVFNKIKTEHHYQLLKRAVETHLPIKAYGYLKPNEEISLKSRHLGLVQAEEDVEIEAKIQTMAKMVEETVDIDGIIADFNTLQEQTSVDLISESVNLDKVSIDGSKKSYNQYVEKKVAQIKNRILQNGGLTLAYAKDQAFSFYYTDNLELLQAVGIKLIPFSPMMDSALPIQIDAVLLGGGYPEIFSEALEQNRAMRESIRDFIVKGGPVYAECGGFMYLTNSITDLNQNTYNMVGAIDADTVMTQRLQRFGHVEAEFEGKVSVRGHEFHHSQIIPQNDQSYHVTVNRKGKQHLCGLKYKNAFGTYVHTHWYSNLEFFDYLISHLSKR
jgi:cobyrinic acid a,c-diamide synthase